MSPVVTGDNNLNSSTGLLVVCRRAVTSGHLCWVHVAGGTVEKYTIFLPHKTLLQVFLECSKRTEILFETRTRSLISFAIYVNE